MALTAKQARFVEEYLVDLNATQAAIRAGYSPKTAQVIGAENLIKPMVAEAVRAAQAARSARTELTQDYVVRGLMKEAEYTDEGASHAARVQAYHLLGKHAGMFKEKVEHSGPGGKPIPHEHSGTITAQIDDLAAAFARAARREEAGGVRGDDPPQPVDS